MDRQLGFDALPSRPEVDQVIAVYTLPSIPQNVTFGEGSLWVDSYDASRIWRIEPEF